MKKFRLTQSDSVVNGLEKIGIEYVVYLPDSTMRKILAYFAAKSFVKMIPISREEEGVGIVAGLEACGKKAILMIQDSGIGNMLNSYVSLASLYRVPMLTITARRGGFNEINEANAEFGEIATELVGASRSMGFVLDYKVPLDKWSYAVENAYAYAHFVKKPILLFINLKDEKGT